MTTNQAPQKDRSHSVCFLYYFEFVLGTSLGTFWAHGLNLKNLKSFDEGLITEQEKLKICNPLILLQKIKKPTQGRLLKIWSGKGGSNSRPQPWQGCALPTELFPQAS